MLFSLPTGSLLTLPNTELARDMQDMRIRKKKRQTIRPLPGSLFLTKTSGVSRIPLKAAGNGKTPARYTKKQARPEQLFQWICLICLKHEKKLFDMFVLLFFSCIAMEFISTCMGSPARLQRLFASL